MDEVVMISISQEDYDSLIEDAEILDCLRAAGVDNWEGFDYAMEIYRNPI